MKKTLLLLAAIAPATAVAQIASTDSIATHELDKVLVYSTRTAVPLKRVPGKIEVIRPEAIATSGLKDLTDLLKNKSSVDVIQYPGFLSNVGIRGFIPDFSRSRYVAVLINGIPSGTSNLSTLSLNGVEQVEVLKGPFSSIYGTNAMGGVINVITKRHTGPLTGAFTTSMGSFGTGYGMVSFGGGITDRLSFDLSASYESQARSYTVGKNNFLKTTALENAILDPTKKGAVMPGSTYGVVKANARLGYQFSDEWSLHIFEDLFHGDGILNGGSIWGVYGASKKDLNRSMTSAELRGRLGNNLLTFTPYYSREQSDNYKVGTESEYRNSSSVSTSWGAILQDELRFDVHRLVLGLDTRNQDTDTRSFKADGSSAVPYQPNVSTRGLGLFAQGHISLLADALNISAGLRADFMNLSLKDNADLRSKATTESFSTLSPNLGLKYELAKGLMAHASIGSAFSAPSAYEKAGEYQTAYGVTRGNAALRPETSLTYDLGLSYTNRDLGIQLDATYFDTQHRQKIVKKSAGTLDALDAQGHKILDKNGQPKQLAVTTFENADKAHMNGLELVASYDFGSLVAYRYSLRAYVNATFMFDSRYLPKGSTAWTQLESIRKQNVTFGLEYKAPYGLELGLTGRYLGKRYEHNWFGYYPKVRVGLSELNQKEMPELAAAGQLLHPAALVWSASAHYDVTKQLRVGANLHNIFSEYYTEKDGYHMPGRSIQFSASYRF
jgi:tonB-dependent heme/hemoglobin receptor family protein